MSTRLGCGKTRTSTTTGCSTSSSKSAAHVSLCLCADVKCFIIFVLSRAYYALKNWVMDGRMAEELGLV